MPLSISNSKSVYSLTMKLCRLVYTIEIALNPRGISPKNSESRVLHRNVCSSLSSRHPIGHAGSKFGDFGVWCEGTCKGPMLCRISLRIHWWHPQAPNPTLLSRIVGYGVSQGLLQCPKSWLSPQNSRLWIFLRLPSCFKGYLNGINKSTKFHGQTIHRFWVRDT